MKIDLHIHSEFSDGVLSVEDLTQEFSSSSGFFSITDHNYLTDKEIRIVRKNIWFPGIEVSTHLGKHSIHLLGYSNEPRYLEDLDILLDGIRQGYMSRAYRIIEKLEDNGFTLPALDQIRNPSLPSPIYTYDIARSLISELKMEKESDVIKWLKENGNLLFVEEDNFMPDTRDVIKLLKKCNFIPIWAHPGTRFLKHGENKVFLDVLNELVDFGLEGLEAYYINHNEYQTKKFVEFANERNLFISCGSDYHGIGRGEKRLLKKYVDFSNIEPLLGKLEINELL